MKMFVFIRILREGIVLALQELWSNKLRSFLSILGITIGIFCVVSVMMMVDSVERNIRSSFKRLGDDIVFVSREAWGEDPSQNWWKYIKRPYPSYREFKAIQSRVPSLDMATIRLFIPNKDIKYKNNSIENTVLVASTHDFGDIYDIALEAGRWFSLSESQLGKNTIILGRNITDELFPNISDPIGKVVKVMGRKVKVIGIMEREGKSLLSNGLDDAAILSYNYLRRYVDVNSKRFMPIISAKANEGVPLDQLKDEIRAALRASRKLKPKEDDNFALNQMSILSSLIDNVFGAVNVGGWIIGLFSILVGGFGIANIMFVSVKERTGMIGIKKSLGAKSHFILFEFLIEAICLCVIGGLVGLILVKGIAVLGNKVIDSFDLVLSFQNILLGIFISAVVGIISGFIPALNAARMNPVEAIRQNF